LRKIASIIFESKMVSLIGGFCFLPNFIFCLVLLGATPAHSAASCSVTQQDFAFGNINLAPGTAIDMSATLQVICSGAPVGGERLCISMSSTWGATWNDDATSRKMGKASGSVVRYNLYTNAARTTLWGSWVDGYQTGAGVQMDVANGTTNVTVYARILASQQAAESGAYTAANSNAPALQYRDVTGAGNCPVSGGNTTTTTGSYNATATVLPSCTVSATNMNFGTQTYLTSNVDATSTITANCTSTATYTVSLSNGNTGTGPTVRKLVNGASNVTYGIYSNAARSVAWGSTIGTNTVSGTGTGANQTLTAYGRVPIQTTPTPGTYTDTVVVTVTY
jgi:spore coat protein U-like protein